MRKAMKTGIVTFPKAINYGTALQAAAMKNVLSQYGGEVFFIDHACPEIDKSNAVFDLREAKDPRYVIAHSINLSNAIKRRNNFEAFGRKYIPVKSVSPDDCDIVVAGSDQIWNYNLTGNDLFYFLDYEKKHSKKVSYAGSFGLSAIDEKYQSKYAGLLRDFDAIGVREATARKLIGDIAGIDVPVVLDPTLLINADGWKEMSDKSFNEKGYIFLYTVFNSESLWDFATRLSKKTGLPIKTISYSKLHRHNADYSFTSGPDGWVARMLNADYVVTNSFHGFAFSVNFGKQFFFELPPEKSGVGSRLHDMARKYGIEDRELTHADMGASLDTLALAQKLAEDRKASFEFIDSFMK